MTKWEGEIRQRLGVYCCGRAKTCEQTRVASQPKTCVEVASQRRPACLHWPGVGATQSAVSERATDTIYSALVRTTNHATRSSSRGNRIKPRLLRMNESKLVRFLFGRLLLVMSVKQSCQYGRRIGGQQSSHRQAFPQPFRPFQAAEGTIPWAGLVFQIGRESRCRGGPRQESGVSDSQIALCPCRRPETLSLDVQEQEEKLDRRSRLLCVPRSCP